MQTDHVTGNLSHATQELTVLMQLEVTATVLVPVCAYARRHGRPVAFKPSPLGRKQLPAAHAVLDAGVTLCFVNEHEAVVLLSGGSGGGGDDDTCIDLGEGGQLLTLAHAELAAERILARWDGLRTVVVTCATAHLLLERSPSAWRCTDHDISSFSVAGLPKRSGNTDTAEDNSVTRIKCVLPRDVDPLVVDVIGAADAFVGGFVASSMEGVALPWRHLVSHSSRSNPGPLEESVLLPRFSRMLLTPYLQPAPHRLTSHASVCRQLLAFFPPARLPLHRVNLQVDPAGRVSYVQRLQAHSPPIWLARRLHCRRVPSSMHS